MLFYSIYFNIINLTYYFGHYYFIESGIFSFFKQKTLCKLSIFAD
jgi:hypothetical protein